MVEAMFDSNQPLVSRCLRCRFGHTRKQRLDLFDHQLFPSSDHIHTKLDPANPESSYLRPTPFGEIFDVLLTSVLPEIVSTYPVILLAGECVELRETRQ